MNDTYSESQYFIDTVDDHSRRHNRLALAGSARNITFIQELLTISTLETYYLNFIAIQL